MDLSRFVVIDCTTGNCFSAGHAMLVNLDDLSAQSELIIDDGSDAERIQLAETQGEDLEHWSRPTDTKTRLD